MKRNYTTLTCIFSCLMIQACSSDIDTESMQTTDVGYSSALFSPQEQFKTHKIPAFVEPTNQANLSFQVSGVITEQWIKIGDYVEAGQNLFKITNPSLKPQIDQFNSQIVAIEATLEQNKAEVTRVKDLIRTNAISQNELDRLINQRDNLKATKKSIEAQLEQAQLLFNETWLKSPFAGSVSEIYKEPGEVISAGELVMVLGGVTSLEAPLYLPSFMHKNMLFGQPLSVTYQHHEMTAKIKEISMTANPKSQLFKVLIEVPMLHDIKSGEKIQVYIEEQIGVYYRLPIESVIDDGINQPFVFLIDNMHVVQSNINLIDIEGDEVIVQMPQQGEIEVVTAGQASLAPKQKLSQP